MKRGSAIPLRRPPAPESNHQASLPAAFLNMEMPVRQAMALLTLFANQLPEDATDSVGMRELVCDCKLYREWHTAHEESVALKNGAALSCKSADGLCSHVMKTVALLKMLSNYLTGLENDDADSYALARGQELPVLLPSGYLVLASEVRKTLVAEYKAAGASWNNLKCIVASRAAAVRAA